MITIITVGSWMNILEFLCRIAILVNAFLIAFTFDYLPNLLYQCTVSNTFIVKLDKGVLLINYYSAHKN